MLGAFFLLLLLANALFSGADDTSTIEVVEAPTNTAQAENDEKPPEARAESAQHTPTPDLHLDNTRTEAELRAILEASELNQVEVIVRDDAITLRGSVASPRESATAHALAVALAADRDVLLNVRVIAGPTVESQPSTTATHPDATATPRPIPTTRPTPTPDRPPRADPLQGRRDLALAQRYLDALSASNWDIVRRLDPTKSTMTDREFATGWGVLAGTALVPTGDRESNGTTDRVRFLLVAYEEDGGRRSTNPFCVTFDIDVERGMVRPGGPSFAIFDGGTRPEGWISIVEAEARWLDRCAFQLDPPRQLTTSAPVDGPGRDTFCVEQFGNAYPYLHEPTGLCYANPIGD